MTHLDLRERLEAERAMTDEFAVHVNVADEFTVIPTKAFPVSADLIIVEDSEDSGSKVKVELGTLAGTGDVSGPVGAVDGNITTFDGISGKMIQDSGTAITTVTGHIASIANPHGVTAVQAGADPAGSASTVQTNLTTHTSDLANPHAVTAVQVGADTVGSAAAVQLNLTNHEGDTLNPHSVTVAQTGGDAAGVPRPPTAHAIGGTDHTPGTLASLNTRLTDATLDGTTDSRTPSGSAGGGLAGAYPNPTLVAGGADTQVQYNDGGSFAGDPNFTFDGSNLHVNSDLTVGNTRLFVDISNGTTNIGKAVTGTDAFNVFGPGTGVQQGISSFYDSSSNIKFRLRDEWTVNSIPPRLETESTLGMAFNTTTNSKYIWYVNGTGNERMRLETAGLGLGTAAANNASAILQMDSTTQGLLISRMTTVQRDAISSPATGLQVYNTTTNELQCFDGSVWATAGGDTTIYNGNGTIDTSAAQRVVTVDAGVSSSDGLLFNALSGGNDDIAEFFIGNQLIDARVTNDDGLTHCGFDVDTIDGIRIFDGANETGAFYHADYSTAGIAIKGDRWIPDAGFVDAKANVLGAGPPQGLHISNNSGTPDEIVDIDSGACRDSTNVSDMVSSGTLTPDITFLGVNGIDTGTVAGDATYFVFIVTDSTAVNPPGGLFSLSSTAPTMPAGYDRFRRIGAVSTDATADIETFQQPKTEGRSRWMYRKRTAQLQAAGTASSFTDTTTAASVFVPSTATRLQVAMEVLKTGGGEADVRVEIVPDGWDETAGAQVWVCRSGLENGTADTFTSNTVEMPVGPTRVIRYRVLPSGDGGADLYVPGYEDSI